MAWNISATGTAAALTAAVNAMPAGASAGESSQITRMKAVMIAEINAVNSAQMSLIANGNYDNDGSVAHMAIQPVKTISTGEIASVPNPNPN